MRNLWKYLGIVQCRVWKFWFVRGICFCGGVLVSSESFGGALAEGF